MISMNISSCSCWHTISGWHILLQTAVSSPRLPCWPTHAEAVIWDVPKVFTVSSFMHMRLSGERKEAGRGEKRTVQLPEHMIANDKHSHAAEACHTEQLQKYSTYKELVTHVAKPRPQPWVLFITNGGPLIWTLVWPTLHDVILSTLLYTSFICLWVVEESCVYKLKAHSHFLATSFLVFFGDRSV